MFKYLKIRRKIILCAICAFCCVLFFSATSSASMSVARAFYELARQGNARKIESLLYRGYSLESVDENGYNPVCIAVSMQDKKSYVVLTSYGATKKPSCLKNISDSSYRRFFGNSPAPKEKVENKSDSPYIITTALLGAGATAAAFALAGGSSSGGGGASEDDPEYPKIANCTIQNKDRCDKCEENYTVSNNGKKCILSITCPSNSSYSSATKKCECNSGYEHFGDAEKCYKKIEGCTQQQKGECKSCNDSEYFLYDSKCHKKIENCEKYNKDKCSECAEGFLLTNNKCIKDCPENTEYDTQKKECICKNGYGKYGQAGDDKCYRKIDNCNKQNKDICNECNSGYNLEDGICYKRIENCEEQNRDTCNKCKDEYNLEENVCYRKIDNCEEQNKNKCDRCIDGYGTHGDVGKDYCYSDIEHCEVYLSGNWEYCSKCDDGYIQTQGICYKKIECDRSQGLTQRANECVCDERRGYYEIEGKCVQSSGEEYEEGDGYYEEWSDLNSIHCNSRGIYDQDTGVCICNEGYGGESCDICKNDNYINFDGTCFEKISCDDENKIQYYNACICVTGYNEINGKCIQEKNCGKGKEQNAEGECVCKQNFIIDPEDENKCICPEEYEGKKYEYEPTMDMCITEQPSCDEKNKNGKYKWTGENCDICPSNFEVSFDEETQSDQCGIKCAENYTNPETGCVDCNASYRKDELTGVCVYSNCTEADGSIKKGYKFENNVCICDTDQRYYLGPTGVCEQKKEDYIGTQFNINNDKINMQNEELRDVYGMKPSYKDQEGNDVFYEAVYNSYNYGQNAEINIENKKSGFNNIYGIYSQSKIYNAAAILTDNKSVTANGSINIKDIDSQAIIYGIHGAGEGNDIYNGFAYNNHEIAEDEERGVTSEANATITINKKNNASVIVKGGNITGIIGDSNIYNAYAKTQGVASGAKATGKIEISNEVAGSIVGIEGTSTSGRISNAYAYLGGAASDTIANGIIDISGNSDIYGIVGKGIVVNSETKFKDKFYILPEFGSIGQITVKGSSMNNGEGAYGIYIGQENGHNDIYNASGYNAKGFINVTNIGGGRAYGIFSNSMKYMVVDGGGEKSIYNNTYNAFRSSAIYDGGDGTQGNINIVIKNEGDDGKKINPSDSINPIGIGIYAQGNVFNSYVKSGSEVALTSQGNIKVTDESSATKGSTLIGIKGAGGVVANAYAEGDKANTGSISTGKIEIEKKSGQGGTLVGIDASLENTAGTTVYNAALINAKSTVNGTITINAKADYNNIYGIHALTDTSKDIRKIVYNAYYSGDEADIDDVTGTISINAGSSLNASNIYGMYVENSIGYNSYSNVENANVEGKIYITTEGSDGVAGNVIGMYAKGSQAQIYNNYNSEINIIINNTNGTSAYGYGMKADEGATAYNNGKISIVSKNSNNQYGMYANNGSLINDTQGEITVEGKGTNYGMYLDVNNGGDYNLINNGAIKIEKGTNKYGIYAINKSEEGGSIKVENNGTIDIVSGNGIYASGEDVVVSNQGTIKIGESDCTGKDCKPNEGTYIVLENNAELLNEGDIESQSSIDLNSYGGNVIISNGGSFKTQEEISGKLLVSSADVIDNFEEKTTLSNAIEAKDVSNLELSSKSYMYDVSLKETTSGTHDIELSLKDFNKITTQDKAIYYDLNYNKNNSELFNILKKQETAKAYSKAERQILGEYMLPNMVEEELRVSRSLDDMLVADLFNNTRDSVRVIAGTDAVFLGRDDTDVQTGYELDSQSMYTMYDKKINNKYRLGLGLSFTHTNTDYNDNSSRKNFMVQGYVPVTYSLSNALKFVSLAKLGYQNGEYTRYGVNNDVYDANTSAITYGLSNQLRYIVKADNVTLTPFVGINASGIYNKSIKERGGELALDIDATHIFSLESALGLYADIVSEINDKSKITTTLGLAYYHEFANPYNSMNAKIINTLGSYKLRNNSVDSRDRGVLSAKINYDYKDFSIYGEILQYLEKEYPVKLDLGLKYKF